MIRGKAIQPHATRQRKPDGLQSKDISTSSTFGGPNVSVSEPFKSTLQVDAQMDMPASCTADGERSMTVLFVDNIIFPTLKARIAAWNESLHAASQQLKHESCSSTINTKKPKNVQGLLQQMKTKQQDLEVMKKATLATNDETKCSASMKLLHGSGRTRFEKHVAKRVQDIDCSS
ncbi:hypothetical protein SLS59_009157 [Nothophoma quercina]|uniref:Uncharacterized protein n=1 Tax=Nothophoma quercina TaxID=749835 RepID=A0ABR3QNU7_9PLEO